ncbi:EpsG family protein [Flavobacterium frigidarium]|uniref:EpsG family protein n=1 Tax=Flavobacterium frigidarium TaxID=99286 RepID=UPI00041D7CBB|nr:EpsG family protein [Flavobacterium frigidarium]
MITYIVLFILLVLFSFTDYIYTAPLNRKLILFLGSICTFTVLWSFASLRWKTGTDWDSYYDSFYYFSEIYAVNFEPGFVVILSFVRDFTSNYSVFLSIFSFLCISLKFSYFYKYHKEFFFTLILLFYSYYFADIFAVRQNLAISLTLFSTIFIIKRKPLFFTLFVFLASSIHYSSILYFFAYYIYWSKISNKRFYYFAALSVAFGLIGIGGIILDLILKALGIDGFIGAKINNYLIQDNGDPSSSNGTVVIYLLGVTKRFILIPIFIYVKNKSKGRFIYFEGYFNLYMIGNLIYFLFAKDLAVFARASVPFLLFEIFLIGYTMYFFKSDKKKMIVVFFMMLLFSWARFNALVNSYYELYVPYNSIFDIKIERNLE